MAVTVYWVEFNGSDGGSSQGSALVQTINFGSADVADMAPANYPIAAGSNSFAKYIKVHFSGSFTQISNARLWKSDGVYKAGEVIKFSGNYAKASAPSATALPAIDGNAVPDIPTTSPADPNICLPNLTTDILEQVDYESTPGYASGAYTSMMAFQLQTTSSTPAGAVNQKTISLTYDRQ